MTGDGALVPDPSAVLASAVNASALAGDRDEAAGVGVDVVCVSKMSRLVSEGGPAFLQRCWTSHELAEAGDDPERLATRWAAKEAVMKCLGVGISDLDPRDVEIVSQNSGAPSVVLRGSAAGRAQSLGISEFHVSATHESGWAAAIAVASASTEHQDSKVAIQREDGS
ncbi:holo-ACP synthase [Candidatus Poriferisodalis sp.]|uniref:holo-ACP synthase n=1 Tax=Candidatus Poriferisodalis sp. TaxID=3101277 RepID=UPI003B51E47C